MIIFIFDINICCIFCFLSVWRNISVQYQGKEFFGDIIQVATVVNADACCEVCEKISRCIGFSFIADNCTCTLFSQIRGEFNFPCDLSVTTGMSLTQIFPVSKFIYV